MDINLLRSFIAVAETLSFTEAGARLSISQSAVSQQIAELERLLGAKLILRNKRPFQLTPSGKVVLKEAASIVAKAEDLFTKIKFIQNGFTGTLRVGFLAGVEQDFLTQGIREFCEFYPRINLILQHFNWTELTQAMMNDDIDVGFTIAHNYFNFPELTGISLYTDVFCVALPHNHRLAGENTINISRLAHEPFVTFPRQTDRLLHDFTIQLCAEHGFMPVIVSHPRDMAAILFMVKLGCAISIVPSAVRKTAISDVRFVEIESPERYHDFTLTWKKDNLNPSIPVFIEKVKSTLRCLPVRSEAGKRTQKDSGRFVLPGVASPGTRTML
jgi:DNA-binding transcriptional LysR family regulator